MTASGQPGLRYYLPRPYLLVTEVPYAASAPAVQTPKEPVDVAPPPGADANPTPKPAATPAQQHPAGAAKGQNKPAATPAPAPAPAAADKPNPVAKDDSGGDKGGDSSSASPTMAASASTDASYQHSFNQYQVKLVYLPDLSRPMAITVSAGIGTVSLQPTLVDGWMLTSLQGSADSKVSEVLGSVAALVTAQKGPATAAAGAAKGGDGKAGAAPPPKLPLLGPGLYSLEYNKSGVLTEVCAVTLFDGSAPGNSAKGGIGLCKRARESANPVVTTQ
ncbi:hypothetical protein SNE35_18165 [Paucibacter sp. R3-3]|uniref:Uncharacterized protein n=1 Tax=Roseateles agri TaxID=3098619 RepID=A0ABU5DJG6_9BURK|nr:hypothetical protein [Paucibacter sp. R3-3]MDY0746443.1 hypothetical protein [Paucibacter sp. R3-3]